MLLLLLLLALVCAVRHQMQITFFDSLILPSTTWFGGISWQQRATSNRNCLVRNAHLSVIRFWPVSDNMFDKQQQQRQQQSVVCTRSRSLIAPTVATWQSVSPQFAYKSDNIRFGIQIEIVLREFPLQKKCAWDRQVAASGCWQWQLNCWC